MKTNSAILTYTVALWLAGLSANASALGAGTGGGTIYFSYAGQMYTMSSDGSGKTPVPAGVYGVASYALHGGARWHLYTANNELYALRGDAPTVTVQLTDSSDGITALGGAWWAKDDPATTTVNEADSFVSYAGSDASGNHGLYRAYVAFDGAGTPSQSNSSQLLTSGDFGSVDWAPNGNQFVYAAAGLYIYRIDTQTSNWLTDGRQPEWSPSGAKIAFGRAVGWDTSVCTINPDGSGLQTLVRGRSTGMAVFVENPHWSPGSTHLIYWRYMVSFIDSDVYRVQASGSQPTNLTSDLVTNSPATVAFPLGWR